MTTQTRDADGMAADAPDRPRAQHAYTRHFTEFSKVVKESGLLRRRYGYYWTKMSLTVLALIATGTGIALLGDSWFQLVLAGVLALIFGQIMFLGHDAAHRQIFRSSRGNDWVGLIFGSLLTGLSLGWWQNKHSKHHAHPNKHESDPDVSSGVLAFTPYTRAQRKGIGAFLADRQGWFFFPLLLLEGLNLYVNSTRRLFGRAKNQYRFWEIAFVAIRFTVYVGGLLLVMSPGKVAAFLGVQLALFGLYMGAVFAPNHVGMPTVPPDMKIDFLRRQVLMSRNITGGRFVNFMLGGLNYQIEHHLFPSMPRPNLRRLQPLVRRLCEEHGIKYTEADLFGAYRTIVGYLNNVGLRGTDPFGCPLAAQLRAPI